MLTEETKEIIADFMKDLKDKPEKSIKLSTLKKHLQSKNVNADEVSEADIKNFLSSSYGAYKVNESYDETESMVIDLETKIEDLSHKFDFENVQSVDDTLLVDLDGKEFSFVVKHGQIAVAGDGIDEQYFYNTKKAMKYFEDMISQGGLVDTDESSHEVSINSVDELVYDHRYSLLLPDDNKWHNVTFMGVNEPYGIGRRVYNFTIDDNIGSGTSPKYIEWSKETMDGIVKNNKIKNAGDVNESKGSNDIVLPASVQVMYDISSGIFKLVDGGKEIVKAKIDKNFTSALIGTFELNGETFHYVFELINDGYQLTINADKDGAPDPDRMEVIEDTESASLNEGILGNIWDATFGKIGKAIEKHVPSSVKKKIDAVLNEYESQTEGLYSDLRKERDKIYKAKHGNKDRAAEIKERSEEAIKVMKKSYEAEKDLIQSKLSAIVKDEKQAVKDYAKVKSTEIKAAILKKDLEQVRKFADEDALKEIEKEAKAAEKAHIEAQKEAEKSIKEEPKAEEKKNEEPKKEEAKSEEPKKESKSEEPKKEPKAEEKKEASKFDAGKVDAEDVEFEEVEDLEKKKEDLEKKMEDTSGEQAEEIKKQIGEVQKQIEQAMLPASESNKKRKNSLLSVSESKQPKKVNESSESTESKLKGSVTIIKPDVSSEVIELGDVSADKDLTLIHSFKSALAATYGEISDEANDLVLGMIQNKKESACVSINGKDVIVWAIATESNDPDFGFAETSDGKLTGVDPDNSYSITYTTEANEGIGGFTNDTIMSELQRAQADTVMMSTGHLLEHRIPEFKPTVKKVNEWKRGAPHSTDIGQFVRQYFEPTEQMGNYEERAANMLDDINQLNLNQFIEANKANYPEEALRNLWSEKYDGLPVEKLDESDTNESKQPKKVNESSWDSFNDNTYEIHGVTISTRFVYDTPHSISLALFVDSDKNKEAIEKLINKKISIDADKDGKFAAEMWGGYFELKSWDAENKNIDARSMDDDDVMSYFDDKIVAFLTKCENKEFFTLLIKRAIKGNNSVQLVNESKQPKKVNESAVVGEKDEWVRASEDFIIKQYKEVAKFLEKSLKSSLKDIVCVDSESSDLIFDIEALIEQKGIVPFATISKNGGMRNPHYNYKAYNVGGIKVAVDTGSGVHALFISKNDVMKVESGELFESLVYKNKSKYMNESISDSTHVAPWDIVKIVPNKEISDAIDALDDMDWEDQNEAMDDILTDCFDHMEANKEAYIKGLPQYFTDTPKGVKVDMGKTLKERDTNVEGPDEFECMIYYTSGGKPTNESFKKDEWHNPFKKDGQEVADFEHHLQKQLSANVTTILETNSSKSDFPSKLLKMVDGKRALANEEIEIPDGNKMTLKTYEFNGAKVVVCENNDLIHAYINEADLDILKAADVFEAKKPKAINENKPFKTVIDEENDRKYDFYKTPSGVLGYQLYDKDIDGSWFKQGNPSGDMEWLKAEAEDSKVLAEFLSKNEGLFDKIGDKLKGIKKYILNKFVPSKAAQAFIKRNIKAYKDALMQFGVEGEDLLTKAVQALYDYAGGTPMLKSIEMEYDAPSTTLTLQPKKGAKGASVSAFSSKEEKRKKGTKSVSEARGKRSGNVSYSTKDGRGVFLDVDLSGDKNEKIAKALSAAICDDIYDGDDKELENLILSKLKEGNGNFEMAINLDAGWGGEEITSTDGELYAVWVEDDGGNIGFGPTDDAENPVKGTSKWDNKWVEFENVNELKTTNEARSKKGTKSMGESFDSNEDAIIFYEGCVDAVAEHIRQSVPDSINIAGIKYYVDEIIDNGSVERRDGNTLGVEQHGNKIRFTLHEESVGFVPENEFLMDEDYDTFIFHILNELNNNHLNLSTGRKIKVNESLKRLNESLKKLRSVYESTSFMIGKGNHVPTLDDIMSDIEAGNFDGVKLYSYKNPNSDNEAEKGKAEVKKGDKFDKNLHYLLSDGKLYLHLYFGDDDTLIGAERFGANYDAEEWATDYLGLISKHDRDLEDDDMNESQEQYNSLSAQEIVEEIILYHSRRRPKQGGKNPFEWLNDEKFKTVAELEKILSDAGYKSEVENAVNRLAKDVNEAKQADKEDIKIVADLLQKINDGDDDRVKDLQDYINDHHVKIADYQKGLKKYGYSFVLVNTLGNLFNDAHIKDIA